MLCCYPAGIVSETLPRGLYTICDSNRRFCVGWPSRSLHQLGLLVHGYFTYMNERLALMPLTLIEKAGEKGGESAIMGLGGFVAVEYALRFTTILLAYFVVEGAVLTIAAIGG